MDLIPEFSGTKLADFFRILILAEKIETRKKSENINKHFSNSPYLQPLLKYTSIRDFKLNWSINGITDISAFG